jgi:hypothetical protein
MSNESALAMMTGQPAPTAPSPATPVADTTGGALQSTPFNQLAKKEAELVRQKEQFKRERQTIEAEKVKLAEIQKQYNEYEEKKKSDPVAALKMLGFSETDIFNYMAANEKKEPTTEEKAAQAAAEAADARIKAYEEAQQKKIIEQETQRDNSLIAGFKSDISNAIKANVDKFEYCNYYGKEAEALAYEITLETLKTTQGKDVLTPSEALELAEEYFENRDKEMMTLKKRQPAVPVEKPAEPAERTRTVTPGFPNEKQPNPVVNKTRTLTSAATSSVASARLTKNETREQKRERLMDRLRNGT